LKDEPQPLGRISHFLLLALLSAPLAAHAYVGSFMRYMADDYCTAGILSDRGLLGSQVYWYTVWSGRYAFHFSVNLLELIGPGVVRFLPAAALVIWTIILSACIRIWMGSGRGLRGWSVPVIFSELLLVAAFDATPNLVQSLYWQTGMLTYAFPLILITALLGIAGWLRTQEIPSNLTRSAAVAGGVLAWVTGGYSETIVSVQTAAVVLFLALILWNSKYRHRKPLRHFLVAALIGSLIAIAIVIAAPGNATRQEMMPPPPGIVELSYLSNRYALAFSAKAVLASPLTALLCLAIPFVFAGPREQAEGTTSIFDPPLEGGIWRWSRILFPPALGYLLILATTAPYVYTIGVYPDDRVLITAQYILNCTLAATGFQLARVPLKEKRHLLAQRLKRSQGVRMLLIILALGASALAVQRSLAWLPDLREYARRWDRRAAEIQAAVRSGATSLAVERLPRLADLGDVSRDPERWINRCIARTYGLETIVRE
jgi:hypothetical protein